MSHHEGTPLLSSNDRPKRSWAEHFGGDINADRAQVALALQCFVAGWANAAVYAQTKTWVAFMTGNLTQLAMNVVSLISFRIRNSNSKHSPTSGTDYAQRILLSSGAVAGFAIGAFLSQRAVSRWGAHHRGRLAVSALLRASAAALVGVLILSGIDLMGPKAPLLLAILATGMGAQALIGQRVANAPWATTVVFTATFTQIFADPLFPFLGSPGRARVISVSMLLLGAASAQVMLELAASEGHAVAITLGALMLVEVVVAAAWTFSPSKPDE